VPLALGHHDRPEAAASTVSSSDSNELDLGTEPIAPAAIAAATPGWSTLPLTTSTFQPVRTAPDQLDAVDPPAAVVLAEVQVQHDEAGRQLAGPGEDVLDTFHRHWWASRPCPRNAIRSEVLNSSWSSMISTE